MARTLEEIEDSILVAKDASAELSTLEVLTENEEQALGDIDSESSVSIWRKIVYVVSLAMLTLEKFWDLFRTEITELLKKKRIHGTEWYKEQALAFQYGDALNIRGEYDVIDPDKQIIKQVAAVEGDRTITFKIATLDGDQLVKIEDVDQVNAFIAYMNQKKDAGTRLLFVNENADKLKVNLEFYYDALLVKADATLISDPSVNVVQKAINDYLKSLDFNGTFSINRMTDFIQLATGYKDVRLTFVGFKAGSAVSYSPIVRQYLPLAGYMKLEEISITTFAV